MDNLDFRKYLTSYGVSYEEYQDMTADQKKELTDRFKSENKTNSLTSIGKGLQGLGCLIFLVPLLGIMLYFLFSIIF